MNPYLNIYLGENLKAEWTAYCARLGQKPGAALKKAIEAQLEKSKAVGQKLQREQPRPKKQKPETTELASKKRIELRLTPSEQTAVTEFSEADECSPQRWIINVLRTVITKKPQFGLPEWKTLGESNYQLLAIGKNLNQIARHLNEEAKFRKRVTVDEKTLTEKINELTKAIKQHAEKADSAMRASVERWMLTS
jgi:ribosomal protein S15P/S13E